MSKFTEIVSQKFLVAIEVFDMLDGVKTVVVGFSGGADSVCLLHLLHTVKDEFGFNIKAVHINHGIRGEEAERDALFAKDFCNKFQIPFEIVQVDCIAESKQTKESLEECGRRIRYEVFNRFAQGDSKIATAHNANDNAETIILNITRGTSVKGVCGIPITRDNIIRPILNCSRSEIEGYCQENGLSFVTDSTNLSNDYTRNKIRNLILPVIKDINPSFLDAFSSLSNSASNVTEFISAQADLLLKKAQIDENLFDRSILLENQPALISEVLFVAYKKFSGLCLDSKKINTLMSVLKNGGRVQLFGNDFVEVKKNYIRFYKVEQIVFDKSICINSFPFSAEFNNYSIKMENFDNNSKIVNQNSGADMIDLNSVAGELVLRTRTAGDKFTFNKRGITKPLKKLFTEDNVPVEMRNQIPVISDDSGVVWVQGYGVSKRCIPTKNCGNIILVRGEYNDR